MPSKNGTMTLCDGCGSAEGKQWILQPFLVVRVCPLSRLTPRICPLLITPLTVSDRPWLLPPLTSTSSTIAPSPSAATSHAPLTPPCPLLIPLLPSPTCSQPSLPSPPKSACPSALQATRVSSMAGARLKRFTSQYLMLGLLAMTGALRLDLPTPTVTYVGWWMASYAVRPLDTSPMNAPILSLCLIPLFVSLLCV